MLNTGSIHDINCQWVVLQITSWPLKPFVKVVLIYNLYSSQWFVVQIGCQESFLTFNVMLHSTSMWLTAVSWRIKFVIGKPSSVLLHFIWWEIQHCLTPPCGRYWEGKPELAHQPVDTRGTCYVSRRQENRSSNQGSALISCVWKTLPDKNVRLGQCVIPTGTSDIIFVSSEWLL